MYEYLKLLQTHMETMRGWMGTTQGMMRQMPPPTRADRVVVALVILAGGTFIAAVLWLLLGAR